MWIVKVQVQVDCKGTGTGGLYRYRWIVKVQVQVDCIGIGTGGL